MSSQEHQRSSLHLIPLEEVVLSDTETEDSATDSESTGVGFPYERGTRSSTNFSSYGLLSCGCCPRGFQDRLRMCVYPRPATSSEAPCRCHESCLEEGSQRRTAVYRLLAAGVISVLFIVGEVIGGSFANSLAILTDAAHKLSDCTTIFVSLLSLWLASRHPNKRLLFGWHRAEVVGALFSLVLIWMVTGALMYEAVERIIQGHQEINADIMLITACVGVIASVILCSVLKQHSHGHSHTPHKRKQTVETIRMRKRHVTEHCNGTEPVTKEVEEITIVGLGDETKQEGVVYTQGKGKDMRSINVRVAFVHSIGDLFKSFGVVIAGYIIKFKPDWSVADPICTLIFSVMVFASTLTVLRDTILVVMEGVPLHVDSAMVRRDLMKLEGVCGIHDFFVWSLTTSKLACAAHLVTERGMELSCQNELLCKATSLLKKRHQFTVTVLQVEQQETEASNCCPHCKCQYLAFNDATLA